MPTCLLCGVEFDTKGMWAHKRKKQACLSQKKALYMVKQLKQLMDNHEKNEDIERNIKNIQGILKKPNNDIKEDVNDFGQEDMTIFEEKKNDIIKSKMYMFTNYVREIFCNPNVPRNQNIKVTSMSGIYCKVYRDGKWHLKCFDKIMYMLAKRFYDEYQDCEDKNVVDYSMFLYQVLRYDEKATRKFNTYTKKYILPEFYNITKM